MATTKYVEITRQELEDWLKEQHYKWVRDTTKQGIYFIELSPFVGVKLSSTIGFSGAGLAVGKASMSLSLVSLLHGHTLNKKDADRAYFQRTKNWRVTWAEGVEHWKQVFKNAESFYNNIARVKDRDSYRIGWLEKINNSNINDSFVNDLKSKLTQGSILSEKQEAALEKALAQKPKDLPNPTFQPVVQPSKAKAPTSNEKRREQIIAIVEAVSVEDRRSFQGYLNLLKNGEALSAAQVKELYHRVVRENLELNEYFDGEPEMQDASAKAILTSFGNLEPLPASAPQEVSPSTSVSFTPQQKAFLERLERLKDAAKNNSWLVDFVNSILKQINQGKTLSEKQKEVLKDNLVKYNVR